MVPSTGYLRWFDLVNVEAGFTLRYPRRHNPTELLPMPEYPKLLGAFLQYGDWLAKLGIDNVGSLNDAIESGRSDQIVLVSEAFHENHLARIANQIGDQLDRSAPHPDRRSILGREDHHFAPSHRPTAGAGHLAVPAGARQLFPRPR